jgi:hypothetical protein
MADTRTLFADFDIAVCFAQGVANGNGAPVRVVYHSLAQWYFIGEDPDGEWLDLYQDAALVDPQEVSA